MNRKWAIVAVIYLCILLAIMAIANLGLLPVSTLERIPAYDTFGHFFLYGTASALSHLACNRRKFRLFRWQLPLGPVLFSIFAVAEELLQAFIPNRSFSLIDLTADFCGIILFYLMVKNWRFRH